MAISPSISATDFRRARAERQRIRRDGSNKDVAHIIAECDGHVLYNVESSEGGRFKHRYLPVFDFAERWS